MSILQEDQVPILSAEAAKLLLDPYLDSVRVCIDNGWEAWRKFGDAAPDLRAPLSKRSRASFVYDHIAFAVQSKFEGVDAVSIREKGGFLTLEIENHHTRAVLRFKKLDKRMRGRNYQTNQQVLFSLQLQLPGWPADATRLVAGYQLDTPEVDVDQYLITCPVGRNVEWFFTIDEAGGGRVVQIPSVPAAPQAPQKQTQVVAKGVKKAESEDEK
ncbi:MAG: hypothetical protein ABSG26_13675 [Bryobacteraceae bacterium]|jgi:hypothetical protein